MHVVARTAQRAPHGARHEGKHDGGDEPELPADEIELARQRGAFRRAQSVLELEAE